MGSLFIIIILVVFIFNILQLKKKVLSSVKKGCIIALIVVSGISLLGIVIQLLLGTTMGGMELMTALIFTITPSILLLTAKDK